MIVIKYPKKGVLMDEIQRMSEFFDARKNTYEDHMLNDLGFDAFYEILT